jgi:hypothetical protein
MLPMDLRLLHAVLALFAWAIYAKHSKLLVKKLTCRFVKILVPSSVRLAKLQVG